MERHRSATVARAWCAAGSVRYCTAVNAESRDDHGRLVLPLSASTDTTHLRVAGDVLTNDLGFEQLDRFHAPEQKWWDFELSGTRLFLHWHHERGLALTANDTEVPTERLARQVSALLKARL